MNAPIRRRSLLAAAGALSAAAAVALSAYAAHGVDGEAQVRLQAAALQAFGHGVALALLGPLVASRLGRTALSALLAGMVLFSGSLTGAVLFGWPAAAAPVGGLLLIAGWLLLAADHLRS